MASNSTGKMMTDIPNYIAVPISLVVGVISTYFINKNQTYIEYWFSKRRDASILKRRDKALAEYRNIISMKKDVIFAMSKIIRVMIFVILYFLMGVIALQLASMFTELGTKAALVRLMVAFDLRKDDMEMISSVQDFSRYLSILSLTVAQISIFLGFLRAISLASTLSRLSNFNAFETKFKDKWGDIN